VSPAGADPAGTAPACRHFGRCGGCSRLDQPIGVQLDARRAAVAALLGPVLARGGAGVAVEIGTAPPPRLPLHTRTKLSWPVRVGPDGRPELGMYERGSHRLVRIDECLVQDPALTGLQRRAGQLLREAGVDAYDERTGQGTVRAFHARLMPGTGELLLGLTTRAGRFPAGPDLAAALLDAAAGLRDAHGRRVRPVGLVRSILDEPGNALLGRRQVPLAGRDHQFDRAGGLEFRVSFGSFYQSHRNADAVLYRPALAMLGPVAGIRAVDGYGGVGTFGLRLARAGAAQVEIVESNRPALADAAESARRNGLAGVRTVAADFAAAALEPGPEVCVVDPPRRGLGADGVERALALGARRLLYVACDPRALARDLPPLLAGGYRVAELRIADLFPHTEHVETLCLLTRGAAPARLPGTG
jgi:23S rRNA (uracil1939-C5)-methyltransferase